MPYPSHYSKSHIRTCAVAMLPCYPLGWGKGSFWKGFSEIFLETIPRGENKMDDERLVIVYSTLAMLTSILLKRKLIGGGVICCMKKANQVGSSFYLFRPPSFFCSFFFQERWLRQ